MEHCIAIICEIASRQSADDRSIFQLGYNLGRLSEMTGLGRCHFWDPWKVAVAEWNSAELKRLASELLTSFPAPGNLRVPEDREPPS